MRLLGADTAMAKPYRGYLGTARPIAAPRDGATLGSRMSRVESSRGDAEPDFRARLQSGLPCTCMMCTVDLLLYM